MSLLLLLKPTAPFSPSDISGLKIWLKADAGAGSSDNDPVATWTDQSGTSHSFTQGTSLERPNYRTNVRNGLPVVRFDGTNDSLLGGDLSAVFPSAGSVFCAVNGTDGDHYMVYATGPIDSWWSFAGAGYWGPFRSSRLANTPSSGLPFTGWHIWSQTGDGSAYKVWLDGVNQISAGSYTHSGGTAHNIGHQTENGNYMAMDVGELIVYDTALSDTDRGNVEAYLTARWGDSPDGTAAPATVAGTGAVPAPTATGTATALPAAVAGVGSVPAPTATGGDASTATPATVAGVGTVPAPTAMGAAFASPATVAGVGSVPAPTASGGAPATATPAAVAGVGSVPAPTAKGNALAAPARVIGTGAVPAPSILIAPVVTPATVAAIGRVPFPTAQGEGTGGGGGTPGGVTDYWSIVLASSS